MAPFAGVSLTLASFAFFKPHISQHMSLSDGGVTGKKEYVRSTTGWPLHESSDNNDEDRTFAKLCNFLKVGPTPGLLRLGINDDTGIRGIYPNSNLKEGDIILSIPLNSCLRDDKPPTWLKIRSDEDDNDEMAHQWPTRLTASLVDLQLREKTRKEAEGIVNKDKDEEKGKYIWLNMLPDPNLLRASIPMHWSEDTLSSTKSVSLQISVDNVYFTRALAIPDLISSVKKSDIDTVGHLKDEQLEQMFQDAFDVVQTRCCAVDHPTATAADNKKVRLVAPVFDFLNHGTGRLNGSPNAMYESRVIDGEPMLVVTATNDININEEVFIDYGESAHTAWKCLGSYGFVPHYESGDERSTAELYVDGVRSEVGGDSVPFELIEAASNALDIEMDENYLTPAVALRIAEKAFDFADELYTIDESEPSSTVTAVTESEEDIYSSSLAISLRQHQSKILREWAFGLKQFAAAQCTDQY